MPQSRTGNELTPQFPDQEPGTLVKPAIEVALALVWKSGRVLVTKRPPSAHLGGLWEFPGGKRRKSETFAACAEREVQEEVGVLCRADRVRTTIRHDYPDRAVELTAVDCTWMSGEPQNIGVVASAWALPEELGRFTFPEANAKLVAAIQESAARNTR